MRILLTGAAGTLGRALTPRLVELGHDVVGVDVAAPDADATDSGWLVGDIRDLGFVRAAVAGVDVVIHTAALHGIHLRDHAPREFLDLNVTGTFNVWEAAAEHHVRGVVFSSTMGVYGDSRVPATDDAIAVLDEQIPLLPGDIYGWSKVAGEELCRYHLRRHAIPSVALRYGMFVPETFVRYGIRLLYGGVHEDDVATAVIAAADALGRGHVAHEAFNVESPLPFSAEDAPLLRRDPLAVVEHHWPGARDLLTSRGVTELRPITEVFPVRALEERLGVALRHDFTEWLDDLRRRPDARAEQSPPWP